MFRQVGYFYSAVHTEEEQKEDVNIYPYPMLTIMGQVVYKGTDEPVDGIMLEVRYKRLRGFVYGREGKDISDTDGFFSFSGLREGTYILGTSRGNKYHMELDKFGNDRKIELVLKKDGPSEEIIIEVESGKSLSGLITNEDGEPLVDVAVTPSCKPHLEQYFPRCRMLRVCTHLKELLSQ